eukprot:3806583-Pyramimonas_sp.AAC.1
MDALETVQRLEQARPGYLQSGVAWGLHCYPQGVANRTLFLNPRTASLPACGALACVQGRLAGCFTGSPCSA